MQKKKPGTLHGVNPVEEREGRAVGLVCWSAGSLPVFLSCLLDHDRIVEYVFHIWLVLNNFLLNSIFF